MMRRSALVVVVILFAMADPASAVPGDLDPSFAGTGQRTDWFSDTRHDLAEAVLSMGNGKIVVVGHVSRGSHSDFVIARYLADGHRDPSFNGPSGYVFTNLNGRCSQSIPCSNDVAYDAARDSAGRIVVVGSSLGDVAVARYEANGALDPTFDGDGKLWTDLGSPADVARGVAIQPDGRIVVAATTGSDIATLRYNKTGVLDNSFDGNGIKVMDFGYTESAADVAVQPADQRIVTLARQSGGGDPFVSDYLFVRQRTGGALDATFSGDGLVIDSVDDADNPEGVAIQQNGAIVAAGSSFEKFPGSPPGPSYVSLIRLTSGGARDTAFGSGGIVRTNPTTTSDFGNAIALTSGKSQKIVVAGSGGSSMMVVRYLLNGSPDTTFSPGDGIAFTDSFPGYSSSLANAVTIQPDGKIVAVGAALSLSSSDYDTALARFLSA